MTQTKKRPYKKRKPREKKEPVFKQFNRHGIPIMDDRRERKRVFPGGESE